MSDYLTIPVDGTQTATKPFRATDTAAAFDLTADEWFTIRPGETAKVSTGLRMAIPEGHVGLVCSRSGLAFNNNVFVLNAPGVIDPDYRGTIAVILHNLDPDAFEINRGDRIAQLLIVPTTPVRFIHSPRQLDETVRGAGGFGSTGVA